MHGLPVQVFLLHYRRFGVVTDLVKPPPALGGSPLQMFSAAGAGVNLSSCSLPPPTTQSSSLLSPGSPHLLQPPPVTVSTGSMSTGGGSP